MERMHCPPVLLRSSGLERLFSSFSSIFRPKHATYLCCHRCCTGFADNCAVGMFGACWFGWERKIPKRWPDHLSQSQPKLQPWEWWNPALRAKAVIDADPRISRYVEEKSAVLQFSGLPAIWCCCCCCLLMTFTGSFEVFVAKSLEIICKDIYCRTICPRVLFHSFYVPVFWVWPREERGLAATPSYCLPSRP